MAYNLVIMKLTKIKYTLERFRWIKVLFSPFKPFKVSLYVGKIQVGVPYFFPRKFVNGKAVPLKVGFSYCSLGWKTKWSDTDFRHEWNPVLSFVFFGYQIALTFYSPYQSHYWEAWLYYEYATDKTKLKRERIEQCRKEHNQTWTVAGGSIDYYEYILKSKYLK
jgi:hypothetical protein